MPNHAEAEAIDLVAWRLNSEFAEAFEIHKASKFRTWMDDTPDGYAYRCLPLVMANQMGWVVTCPVSFHATWSGGAAPVAVDITFEADESADKWRHYVSSHFGAGIITFSIPYLLRTPSGYGLMVRGPTNHFVPGATGLDAYVETSWLELSFTMNWKLLDPGRTVSFRKGDPICLLQPYAIGTLERVEPSIRRLADNAALHQSLENLSASRKAFNENPDRGRAWQKDYFRGRKADGSDAEEHRTKLALRDFRV